LKEKSEKKDAQSSPELVLVILRDDIYRQKKIAAALAQLESLEHTEILALELLTPTRPMVEAHYNKDDAWKIKVGKRIIESRQVKSLPVDFSAQQYGQMVYDDLLNYMTEGPVLAAIISGVDVVARVRELVGHTDPRLALMGTMRATFGTAPEDPNAIKTMRNAVHSSESYEEALREIKIWFPRVVVLDLL
jgi:nucleoside-diphosphate kinase